MIASQANSVFTRAVAPTAVSNIVPLSTSPKRILISEPMREWRDSVLERLNQLVRLEYGWDGYSAPPVSFETAYFALRMLESACGVDTPSPQVVPGSEGDLQIEWHSEGGDIELDVLAPNKVHAWRLTAVTEPNGEEVTLTNDFSVVAKWIKELTEPVRAVGTAAA